MDTENFNQLLEAILGFANKKIKNPAIRVRDMFDPLEAYLRGYVTKTGTPNRIGMRKDAVYITQGAKNTLGINIERHHLLRCESLWSYIIEHAPWNKESLLEWLEEHLITVHLTPEEHLKIGKKFTFDDPWKEFREQNIIVFNSNDQRIDLKSKLQ